MLLYWTAKNPETNSNSIQTSKTEKKIVKISQALNGVETFNVGETSFIFAISPQKKEKRTKQTILQPSRNIIHQ